MNSAFCLLAVLHVTLVFCHANMALDDRLLKFVSVYTNLIGEITSLFKEMA